MGKYVILFILIILQIWQQNTSEICIKIHIRNANSMHKVNVPLEIIVSSVIKDSNRYIY